MAKVALLVGEGKALRVATHTGHPHDFTFGMTVWRGILYFYYVHDQYVGIPGENEGVCFISV